MLRTVLAQLHGVDGLRRLFTELGYLPVDHPFDHDADVVARWKAFKVVGAIAANPRVRCGQIARALAASSVRGLAAAVGPPGELAIAAPLVGQGGITRPLIVRLRAPSSFGVQQLERLRVHTSRTALAHALHVAEVLCSERAGERFFAAFRVVVERMAGSLQRPRSPAERRLLALLALTRVLFLYFVQAKGWLDGRPDYLRDLLNRTLAHRRHFHRAALHPLFFGTLNRPVADRSRRLDLGAIPYLNGGLFEPHPIERRLGPVLFANELWRDAFDHLFERFRFCIHEGDTVDAIAPDMLGRVFERMMDSEERRETGTYYTPESVVRQLVNAAIEMALTNSLPRRTAQRVVRGQSLSARERERARCALHTFRLLDPAVGSGAFLLSALETLAHLHRALASPHSRTAPSTLRRKVLREHLFGVDLNPIAVRLAELRLWLAVIADDPSERLRDIPPLPNLDGVVRQGDTLLDPLGAARKFGSTVAANCTTEARHIRAVRRRLFAARGAGRRRCQQQLHAAERRLAQRLLDDALAAARHAIDDLTTAARSRDLFGQHVGMTKVQRQKYDRWKRLHREVRRAMAALKDGRLPFFSFEVHAPDVLDAGGFTAVVGNPPWVRAESLSDPQRVALKQRFNCWRGSGTRGFAHLPDLSVAFLERCLELTCDRGVVGLLLPSKVVSAGYGEAARRHLVRETSVGYIHRAPKPDAALFGATTYPLALVVKKERPSRRHSVYLGFDRQGHVAQKHLDTAGPWILVPDRDRRALAQFRDAGTRLEQVAQPVLGVKTGADRVFVGRLLSCDGTLALVAVDGGEVCLEAEVLRPALRGRDVTAFGAQPTRVLLWGHTPSGAPKEQLPPRAARYVRDRLARLRRRADDRGGAPWTVYRTRGAVASHPVVWPDLARRPTAVALEASRSPTAIALNTCYIAPAPDRECALVIAAVLNSTWARAFALVHGDEARGGYRRINARLAEALPVPPPGAARRTLAQLSEDAHGEPTAVAEADIDEAVAEALGLSSGSRAALRSLAANHR